MTLALLLTAVTGAWAQGTLNVVEIEVPAAWETDESNLTAADLPGFKTTTVEEAQTWTGAPSTGDVYLIYAFDGNTIKLVYFNGITVFPLETPLLKDGIFSNSNSWKFYYTADAIDVTPGSSANTWTFAMPGSDVVLTPIYAKAAAFATTGTEPDVKTLLPEAAEGVIAGTDDPLIKEGTGIVAFAGESTEATQGTLMYAVTPATVTEAPALDAANKWSATVPTAKTVADDGADVLVWYYIQGADAPEGEAATLDNTFDDTEPASLTVQVLTNKFDIQFNAANANTIEAGKATVTVGGTAATVTEGKLEGVKMGTEVKIKAKDGYKFRKVEVKKKEAAPSLSITNPSVGQVIGSDGKNYISGTLPTGVTAVAKICYVSGNHGLALALTDEESKMNWSTAQTTCAAHTPAFTGGTWKLATQDEWNSMISAIGSYDDLRYGFSSVGGTNMQSDWYWSSTEYEDNSSQAYYYDFYGGYYNVFSKGNNARVRACLAF